MPRSGQRHLAVVNSGDLGANSLFGVHSSLALSLIPIITQNSTSCRNRRRRRNIKKARKFIVKMYNNGCYTHNGNWFAIKRQYLSVCGRGITHCFLHNFCFINKTGMNAKLTLLNAMLKLATFVLLITAIIKYRACVVLYVSKAK